MSYTELFTLLVIRNKVMSMTEFYEADAIDIQLVCANLGEAEREADERMRNVMWAVLAPNSKRKLQPSDIVRFKWDNSVADTAPTTKEQFYKAFKNYRKAK